MKSLLATAVALLILCIPARAQYAVQMDTTQRIGLSRTDFRATQLIAPGILLASGLGVHFLAHDTWDYRIHDAFVEARGDRPAFKLDDYIQYLPLAMDLGLDFAGARAKHGFVDRLIEACIGYATLEIIVRPGKHLFQTLRPNEADCRSFPSGHTACAFTGAELTRMEYGWGWGGGAYGTAAAVGVLRMYNNWHWFSDVLFGAGIGILCAHVGGWLREPVKDLFGIRTETNRNIAIYPAVDPLTGSFSASFAMSF